MKKLALCILTLFIAQAQGSMKKTIVVPHHPTSLPTHMQKALESVKDSLQKSDTEITIQEIMGLLHALRAYSSSAMGLPRMSPVIAEIYAASRDVYKQLVQLDMPKAPHKGKYCATDVRTSKVPVAPLFLTNITTLLLLHNIEVTHKGNAKTIAPLLKIPISFDEFAESVAHPCHKKQ